ncbi:hypothetical protein [Streptomyces sp. NPDC059176]|uniref:hypothetical protein n=1 Tax=unclassified Streptomyces TaxID=2593676 RepID=UPI0036C1723F
MPSTVLTRAAPLLAAGLLLAGCADAAPPPPADGAPHPRVSRSRPAPEAHGTTGRGTGGSGTAAQGGASAQAGGGGNRPGPGTADGSSGRVSQLPGLGPKTRALVPAGASQAVVVTGAGRDSSSSRAVLYERDPVTGWKALTEPWPAHNALKGWTDEHWGGDVRSPIGVFGLTDAGGLLPNPGTRLPYEESDLFNAEGTGFLGEPLAGSFDYVVAINYNREAGTSPMDRRRPLGAARGGGVWLHVDHGGPTQACVSLPLARMRVLLRWLDPAKYPVIVMGDGRSLAR